MAILKLYFLKLKAKVFQVYKVPTEHSEWGKERFSAISA